VTARIVQIRRFYVPEPNLRLVLKLETVEIAGAPRPLAAAPDPRPPAINVKGALQRRSTPDAASLDNKDPHAGVFVFWGMKGNFAMSAGFESRWLTAAQ
jgi:hypothetical protein